MIGQAAIAINIKYLEEPDGTIEFLLCTVWGTWNFYGLYQKQGQYIAQENEQRKDLEVGAQKEGTDQLQPVAEVGKEGMLPTTVTEVSESDVSKRMAL
ncbi:hypothetical protein LZ554_001393 [Drepanopeziza brunnea f. sp. 'monogermtubi']|nr:hypothetical protein LZ554_001393 [Drepanopeziza brunnea f. sp. 'monogermtubi']